MTTNAMRALSRLRTTALGNDFVNEHDLKRDVECIEEALALLADCGRAGCPAALQATGTGEKP